MDRDLTRFFWKLADLEAFVSLYLKIIHESKDRAPIGFTLLPNRED